MPAHLSYEYTILLYHTNHLYHIAVLVVVSRILTCYSLYPGGIIRTAVARTKARGYSSSVNRGGAVYQCIKRGTRIIDVFLHSRSTAVKPVLSANPSPNPNPTSTTKHSSKQVVRASCPCCVQRTRKYKIAVGAAPRSVLVSFFFF